MIATVNVRKQWQAKRVKRYIIMAASIFISAGPTQQFCYFYLNVLSLAKIDAWIMYNIKQTFVTRIAKLIVF